MVILHKILAQKLSLDKKLLLARINRDLSTVTLIVITITLMK